MRFFIQGDVCPFEVIGMAVELPNTGGEVCAVHNAVIPTWSDGDSDSWPPYGVSHVGTGFRISQGDTIDEAIANARKKLEEVGEDGFQTALQRAKELISAMGAA